MRNNIHDRKNDERKAFKTPLTFSFGLETIAINIWCIFFAIHTFLCLIYILFLTSVNILQPFLLKIYYELFCTFFL